MSYSFYKILHLGSLLALFLCLGALVLMAMDSKEVQKHRKFFSIAHGILTLVIFVAGFGLMARLQMMGQSWPGWIHAKLGLWVFVAASPFLIKRRILPPMVMIGAFAAIGFAGAYIAGVKPF